MTSELLYGLVTANLALSVAILVAASLRGLVRRRFGARMAYGLWLAPPLAMLAVFVPRPDWMPDGLLAMTGLLRDATGRTAAAAQGAAQAPAGMPLTEVLGLLWLAGAALAIGLTFWDHRRGVASFGRLSASGGVLRAARNGLGPAMIGIWRPRLVLPADFEARFSDREQALILAHEHHHKVSGDTRINGLVSLVCCLNWFNPLVHLAAHLLRVDQELACDAAVVERFPGERRTYAEALLKSQLPCAPLPLGCTWPSGSQTLLQERLTMLAHKSLARPYQIAGGGLVGVLCLGVAAAAWAASGGASGAAGGPSPAVIVTSAPVAAPVETVTVKATPATVTVSAAPVRAVSTAASRDAVHYVQVVDAAVPPAAAEVCLSNGCGRTAQATPTASAPSAPMIEVVGRSIEMLGRPLLGPATPEIIRVSSGEGGTFTVEVKGRPAADGDQGAPSALQNIVAVRVAN